MAKSRWRHLGDNAIQSTEDAQIIINRFNAEIRKMNTPHYKKAEADKAKAAIAKAKARKDKKKEK